MFGTGFQLIHARFHAPAPKGGLMNLILLILRLLLGQPWDGPSMMRVAVRRDGSTHNVRDGWFGGWLAACEEWLKRMLGWSPPRRKGGRWGLAPGGADGPRRDE